MATVNSPQSALVELAVQSERLALLSANLENTSINQLRAELTRSVNAAERAALEFNAQSRAWSELRGKIKQDSSTYDSLRQQLAELQGIQRGEILRLKAMLDEAQRPSVFADALNLGLSFVLGVLSSLVASRMYDWMRPTK